MSIHHIFYHGADHDGHCSGAIAYHALGEDPNSVKLYAINYGDPFPFDIISKDDFVYMIDFSLSIKEMIKLNNICKKFVWIDHHKNIIDQSNENEKFKEIDGIRNTNRSGAFHAFKYFFPTLKIPPFVQYVSDYDTWQNKNKENWENNILPFHYGLLSIDTLISDADGNHFKDQLDNLIAIIFRNKKSPSMIIKDGRIVLNYKKLSNISVLKSFGYKTKFEGLNMYVCNYEENSSIFDCTDQKEIDGLISYVFNGEEFVVSIYKSETNNKIDVSEIARKYGGNGHPGASGFCTKKLLFEKCGEILFKK